MKITNEAVYFWTAKDFMSNFHYSPFVHKGISFKWSEQAIMWEKALFFGCEEIAEKVLNAQNPQECKNLGRSRKIAFNEGLWVKEREDLYFRVLLSKFSTPAMNKLLLETGERELVEASPFDDIWGVKLAEDDSRILDKSKWLGLNLLGVVLMRVRDELTK